MWAKFYSPSDKLSTNFFRLFCLLRFRRFAASRTTRRENSEPRFPSKTFFEKIVIPTQKSTRNRPLNVPIFNPGCVRKCPMFTGVVALFVPPAPHTDLRTYCVGIILSSRSALIMNCDATAANRRPMIRVAILIAIGFSQAAPLAEK